MEVKAKAEAQVIYSPKLTVSGQMVGLVKDGEVISYHASLTSFLSSCAERCEGKAWWLDREALKKCPAGFLQS